MFRYRIQLLARGLAFLSLSAFPVLSIAEGVPGGYAGVWRTLCPLIADGHGFVDSASWHAMFRLPDGDKPQRIDPWTSVEAFSSDGAFRWGTRLQTSRFEDGKTSAWTEDAGISLKQGSRSELSVSGTDPEGQLSLASVEKAMDKLGFRKIGTVDPYGRDSAYVFVRVDDAHERLDVRYEKGPETIAHVSGLTLTGYRRDNSWTLPHVEGACNL
ncbi:hypothetical protein L2Y96_19545 [Luteibacter aegosomaticola]|uniref:hypothetical protein n=1 Tax=Luteibacter aegosomaticola TaxID=2911538 RepID=UPI001FFB841B|nr:hypothetical protein [Luteibacter aegosomaticola]UPG89565.1 hypothetical protein L2Y96_19545 [Luteibacter aegosomaticola]